MSAEILLTTVNATYQHASFGLRYLQANLGVYEARSRIVEFTLAQKPLDVVESLLTYEPKIIGLGVYIWNTRFILDVVTALKRVRPDIVVVLGGPEVSFEAHDQPICIAADYVVQGESEFLFRTLCENFLERGRLPETKFIKGDLPAIHALEFPYRLYSDQDLQHRFVYVEASRGCPFKCEFCLSSLDTSVRAFPLKPFLNEMQTLLDRGATNFKFVDRTFNLNVSVSAQILRFFLERLRPGLFLHFEMIPDRLPVELRELIAQFPEGTLQFEIGIQTFNEEVGKLISRKQDIGKLEDNMRFLMQKTAVHVHADLIVGLPGETLESFGRGFDRLAALGPHEIQVGMLKRLKGTPIIRHDSAYAMRYDEAPPFRVIHTSTLNFNALQEMDRFAKFWDLYANSGNFKQLWASVVLPLAAREGSLFSVIFAFSEVLNRRHPQRYAIALVNLVESAWVYFSQRADKETVREALLADYCLSPKRDVPAFLKDASLPERAPSRRSSRQLRQQRHLADVKCSVTQTTSVAPAAAPRA